VSTKGELEHRLEEEWIRHLEILTEARRLKDEPKQ